ncbi:hypothetical protein HC174_00270 [Salinimicrobium sp. CDJ15-81-2]|nr:hypothetical protein [Salinimicrobium nanhaiense]
MKRIFFTAAIAGAMFFSAGTVTAQVYENSERETPFVEEQKMEYTQIQQQDLPQEVRKAVEKDYQGATVSDVYSAEKEGEVIYKLVLSTQDGESQELFADAQGNWIQKGDSDLE